MLVSSGYSLVPSRYIEFIDRDLDINYQQEMEHIQQRMKQIMKAEEDSKLLLEKAFKGMGYEIS